MLPEPLHPAVVHFPVALMFFLPIAALAALWRIRRGAAPFRAWALTVGVAAALSLSAWAAVSTGKAQEEQVEGAMAEAPVQNHEEAAERFLVLSVGVLILSGAGLLGGRAGSVARGTAALGTFALLAAGIPVGHSGGQLVYRYGAAAAYTASAGDASAANDED